MLQKATKEYSMDFPVGNLIGLLLFKKHSSLTILEQSSETKQCTLKAFIKQRSP